jgi:hypothetical protein
MNIITARRGKQAIATVMLNIHKPAEDQELIELGERRHFTPQQKVTPENYLNGLDNGDDQSALVGGDIDIYFALDAEFVPQIRSLAGHSRRRANIAIWQRSPGNFQYGLL